MIRTRTSRAILAAALIAGTAGVALAQSGSTGANSASGVPGSAATPGMSGKAGATGADDERLRQWLGAYRRRRQAVPGRGGEPGYAQPDQWRRQRLGLQERGRRENRGADQRLLISPTL
jgi:hypothetical protein